MFFHCYSGIADFFLLFLDENNLLILFLDDENVYMLSVKLLILLLLIKTKTRFQLLGERFSFITFCLTKVTGHLHNREYSRGRRCLWA